MKHGILQQPIQVDDSELSLLRDKLRRRQVVDKLAVLMNVDYGAAAALIDSCTYVIGGTGRVKNVIDQHGSHILSPRLTDGGLSVTDLGAKVIHNCRSISVSEKEIQSV